MDYHELADFIANRMQMEQVYQPVMLGLMLDSVDGVTSEEEASAAFGAVLDDEHKYDVRRYPGDVLIRHGVIEPLANGRSYRLLGFEHFSGQERATLIALCDARLQVYLAGDKEARTESGQLGPGRVYILTSPATPTLFKVGYTTVRAAYRAKEVSRGTGVPEAFDVYYESVRVPDAYQIEQEILHDFAHARPNPNKEFLEVRVLREVVDRLPPKESIAAEG